MKWPLKGGLFFCLALIVALAFRLPGLEERPMHVDEAVHAYKLGHLQDHRNYQENPAEYHGPTLNQFTRLWLKITGVRTYSELTEINLRIVPVVFSVITILLLLLLVDVLGWPVVITAAFLSAVSPAFVFYSGYYIHEMLLVCFTFGLITCGYRYFIHRNIRWAVLAGIFLGLMHATKETFVIAVISIVVASLMMVPLSKRAKRTTSLTSKPIKPGHLIFLLLSALVVSGLFHSSFLANPGGIIDSVQSYKTYIDRGLRNPFHKHPWYYYLETYFFSKTTGKPLWSQWLVGVFAIVGVYWSFGSLENYTAKQKLFWKFMALYALVMAVLYSVIAYKTPWSFLTVFHGMVVLAAIGIVRAVTLAKKKVVRLIISMIVILGLFHLAWQAYQQNTNFNTDTSNPFVYAQTTKDIYKVTEKIKTIALAGPDKENTYIEVVFPAGNYWPLPWYLRSFENAGYFNEVNYSFPSAPIIITSPDFEQELIRKLYEMPDPGHKDLYVSMFERRVWLRPSVEMKIYVKKEMLDNLSVQAPEMN